MISGRPSRTAEYNALFRALETRRPTADRLISDPMAHAFLGPAMSTVLRAAALPVIGTHVPGWIDRRYPGPRPSAVVRTRMIDDALEAALTCGIDQLVVLGAGYDSRAYRMPALHRVTVFEVDHPDTQVVKRATVSRVCGQEPGHVRFVALDLDRRPLDSALARAGFALGARTFYLWEGMVSYLTPAAVDATLRWASGSAAPGSELLMTYVDRGLLDGTRTFPGSARWLDSVAAAGEPFVHGLDPDELAVYLADRSWTLVDDVSTAEALARRGGSATAVPGFYRLAVARRAAS